MRTSLAVLADQCEAGPSPKPCLVLADARGRQRTNTEGQDRLEKKTFLEWLERACELGDVKSCFLVAAPLVHGDCPGIDHKQGLPMLERSCELGDPSGCETLAGVYDTGYGLPRDPARATKLGERARCAGQRAEDHGRLFLKSRSERGAAHEAGDAGEEGLFAEEEQIAGRAQVEEERRGQREAAREEDLYAAAVLGKRRAAQLVHRRCLRVRYDQMMDPLAAFSAYLAGRNRVVLAIAQEILIALDAPDGRSRASDLMWLWTLGAYEIVRTMCQAPRCFEQAFLKTLHSLKADLERVRVPNTKMERVKYDRKAPSVAVPSDRAADMWDEAERHLLVGDPSDFFSSRSLLGRYADVMGKLTHADVRMSHEQSLART